MTTRDLNRLAERVRGRRAELHLDIEPAARSVGMSKDTWRKVESGQSVRETTYTRIDGVLSWAPGSCVALMEGREPVPVEEGPSGAVVADMSKEKLGEEIEIAVQGAAIATTDLGAEAIRKLNQRVMDALQRRGVI